MKSYMYLHTWSAISVVLVLLFFLAGVSISGTRQVFAAAPPASSHPSGQVSRPPDSQAEPKLPMVTATATPTNTVTPTSTPTPDPCALWQVVSSPNVGTNRNHLSGVAVVSTTDVWAVGYYDDGNIYRSLTEHWDGTAWSVVSSPSPGETSLYSVSAVSSNDVWAVGEYSDGTGSYAITIHWNGTSWTTVASPNPGVFTQFHGVAAVSANDVWAVGEYSDGSADRTLTEHWDGTSWSVVSSPSPSGLEIDAVAAISANDVWAVGHYLGGGADRTLMEHWDGTSWSVVPSPNQGTLLNYLNGVAAVSANDVWAVGSYSDGDVNQTLTEHWDGTSWSVVPSPNIAVTYYESLLGVGAVSANDVWAVGYYDDGARSYTLIEHWNGTAWSVTPIRSPGGFDRLYGVAAVSANDVWAVGEYNISANQNQTLVERMQPRCVSPTSTPATTNTPTRTPTPMTVLVGHVTWQGPPAQPSVRQQLPVTLTLCVSSSPVTYTVTTDSSGFFTVTTSLSTGGYNWRAKGPKYLATSGTALLTGGTTTQVEMGTQRAGDANSTHDNIVNTADFTTLKGVFGQASSVGDLNNDGVTNTADFTLLKGNFGQGGAAANCP